MELFNKAKLIEESDKGRYVEATDILKPGDSLFSENSFASIPLENFLYKKDYCFNCCKYQISTEQQTSEQPKSTPGFPFQCKYGCNMWFCSNECADGMVHQLECSFISKFVELSLKHDCDASISLLALRVVMKNKVASEVFEQTVGKLTNQKSIFIQNNKSFLDKYSKLFDQVYLIVKSENSELSSIFNKEEYLEVVCSIFVNSFAGLSNNFNRTPISNGYFYKAALLNHSCEPNTFFSIQNSTLEMRVVKDINKGEQIFDSYVDLLLPTIERQKILLKSKNFVCDCSRCTDITENSRFVSSIHCIFCKDETNYISPKVKYDDKTKILKQVWSCSKLTCQFNKKNNNKNNQEFLNILSDVAKFYDFINNDLLFKEEKKEEGEEQIQPMVEPILNRLVEYETNILSKLHENHHCWLLYHLRLSKLFERFSAVFNSFDYLSQSIQHYKEIARIVECVIKSPSSEIIDSYYHLARVNEKYLLSLINQRNNHIKQLEKQKQRDTTIDIDSLNKDIKNLLKFINTTYKKAYEMALICYGNFKPKTLLLNALVEKSNFSSSN
ncbi:hypothetical protein DICPUDRAFT_86015 [Dictyostelium purpureum]|uniref:SET domain-containing protein n=1 Tax=Dictyostelium purpureum TaxID=5786 RepID=F0Z8Y4_DICPU|nr:uncharacterized protein DICPUDRAFT_86015 [Dictyostelium purpureum]EGC39563.1 hypothetical protein DICPUDRAFT_86015 [Dictyostelium purpureum]|eukprot:XP_003283898.1 hypothetical protein DICPUDRAFT_86015 [Dictyostelium purpureum]